MHTGRWDREQAPTILVATSPMPPWQYRREIFPAGDGRGRSRSVVGWGWQSLTARGCMNSIS